MPARFQRLGPVGAMLAAAAVLAVVAWLAGVGTANGQNSLSEDIQLPGSAKSKNEAFQLDATGLDDSLVDDSLVDDDNPVIIGAEFVLRAGQPGELRVTATIAPGFHVYAMDQTGRGPIATKITIEESSDYTVGQFAPDAPAKEHVDEAVFPGVTLKEHTGRVVWSAPLQIADGTDLGSLKIEGKISWQVCKEQNCRPGSNSFTAKLSAAQSDSDAGAFRIPETHAKISGYVDAKIAAPKGKIRLVLQIEPIDGYHVYELLGADPAQGNKPTLIGLRESSGLAPGLAVASSAPAQPEAKDAELGARPYHDKPVSWTVEFDVPGDYGQKAIALAGTVGYQVCLHDKCERPQAVHFEVNIPVGEKADRSGRTPLAFAKAKGYDELKALPRVQPAGEGKTAMAAAPSANKGAGAFVAVLALAMLGGLILNFMPCVLPVVGLKVLSFVEQSGHNRLRVFMLNLAYSAGVLSIFLVLAAFTSGLLAPLSKAWFGTENLAWGQQFTSAGFNITMTSIVFAMALSFLGVWEIPLPGFVGGKGANDLAAKEGLTGAFVKGMLTTILATPCSGPFVGEVLGFTLGKPPEVVFSVYACAGLGMALPYVSIGAFPVLVKFLPKPGEWMDTFKQIMGFLTLAAVLWLFNSIGGKYRVATLGLLFGLWAGLWWIGRVPAWKELLEKLQAWAIGGATAAAVGWTAFFVFGPREELIAWQPFSRATVERLRAEGKPVMVDFTADWCANCQINMRVVLETEEVAGALVAGGFTSLKADWSEPSVEIETTLAELESKSIPVCAIYPADPARPPIVLLNLITKRQVLDALAEATAPPE